MSANASGARYSLIPRLPTATPPLSEMYTGQGFDALASGGYLSPQQEVAMDRPVFQPLAEIEIDAVTPSNHGFTLTGQGAGPDRAEYRVDLHFELPLDSRTRAVLGDRKSTRLNSSHVSISYAVFCLKKKNYLTQSIVYAKV